MQLSYIFGIFRSLQTNHVCDNLHPHGTEASQDVCAEPTLTGYPKACRIQQKLLKTPRTLADENRQVLRKPPRQTNKTRADSPAGSRKWSAFLKESVRFHLRNTEIITNGDFQRNWGKGGGSMFFQGKHPWAGICSCPDIPANFHGYPGEKVLFPGVSREGTNFSTPPPTFLVKNPHPTGWHPLLNPLIFVLLFPS